MIPNILQEAHSLHIEINRIQKRVAYLFWWAGCANKGEDFVNGFTGKTLRVRFLSTLKDFLILKADRSFICCNGLLQQMAGDLPCEKNIGVGCGKTLRDVFTRLGIPRMLVAENGNN